MAMLWSCYPCFAGASPAIELQSMGSVLGGDGQWLLGELSTGAIGALSPVGAMLREEGQQQEQQAAQQQDTQQQPDTVVSHAAAVQPPQTSVTMAAPVPVSRALPAMGSSMAAATCSLPLTGGPSPGFGFGFGGTPAGAAAAAAAAKQCLFDSAGGAFFQAAANSLPAPPSGGQQQVPPANGAFGSFSSVRSGPGGSYGRGVSAPLPRISSMPGRASLCGAPGSEGMMQMGSMQQPYRPSQHGECIPAKEVDPSCKELVFSC